MHTIRSGDKGVCMFLHTCVYQRNSQRFATTVGIEAMVHACLCVYTHECSAVKQSKFLLLKLVHACSYPRVFTSDTIRDLCTP